MSDIVRGMCMCTCARDTSWKLKFILDSKNSIRKTTWYFVDFLFFFSLSSAEIFLYSGILIDLFWICNLYALKGILFFYSPPSLSFSLFLILFGRWSINFARWIFKRMLAMSLVIVHLFVMCCIMRDINNIIDVYRVVWSLGIKLILDFYNYSIYRDFLF